MYLVHTLHRNDDLHNDNLQFEYDLVVTSIQMLRYFHVILFVMPLVTHLSRMFFFEHFVLYCKRALSFLKKLLKMHSLSQSIFIFYMWQVFRFFALHTKCSQCHMQSQMEKVNHPQNSAQIFKHLILHVVRYIGRDAISYHLHCQP